MRSIGDLKLFQRFHVRLTTLYALVVTLLVILPMGVSFYQLGDRSEMRGLRQRLINTAASLAAGIGGEVVETFRTPADKERPEFQAVRHQIETTMRADPSIYSIYILVPTADPNVMTFAFNLDSTRSQAAGNMRAEPAIGESYDVARFPEMHRGMHEPIAEQDLTYDDWALTISGFAPIKNAEGRTVGILGVDVDGEPVATTRRHVLLVTITVSLFALSLFVLGGVLVGRSIRRPLAQLIQGTSQVAAGDLDAKVDLHRDDEFGVVGGHFDEMVVGLREREHIRHTFGRYVSEDVAQALLKDPSSTALGGEVRNVTVLFSDLHGYSTISEHLSPKEIVELLNQYFGAMNDVIDEHDGVIIELLGDAILAVFGAPQQLAGHPEAAVRCALAMRERLAVMNREWLATGIAVRWQQVGLDKLGHRIGIHTGEVVAGNLGSVRRTKYAVIGDNVNLAARLEQLNKELGGSGILVSGDCVAQLPPELAALCKHVSTQPVKGRKQQVEVFAL